MEPGFAWGIPWTIKYKCAIIAHQERKAGEMSIFAHFERKAGEMPITAHHEIKDGEMPISSIFMTKRVKIFARSINKTLGIPLISRQLSSVISKKEFVIATMCTPGLFPFKIHRRDHVHARTCFRLSSVSYKH